MSQAAESARQQALLAALWSQAGAGADANAAAVLDESGTRAAMGLSAYRANAGALADRALAAVFATVQTMVGTQPFKHLAREFWHARPPQCGDMGEWGPEFPAWLQAHAAFQEWPYLGDCARLDLAIHQCERAADAELNVASLGLLESVDPVQLRIQLMPGTAALASAWPVATIHSAHSHRGAADAEPAAQVDGADDPFQNVRAALQARRGEAVVVARAGWRAHVHGVDEATLAWTRSLLNGAPLSLALEQCEHGFDFGAWLAAALREGWVKEVLRVGD